MDLGFVRSYNESVVLGLVRDGAATRVELAELTGLTPQAVSKIIARLVAAGLVAEGGTRNVGVGKPRTLLTVVPGGAHAFGVHVDRDELRVVLTDLTGAVVHRSSTPLSAGFTPAVVVDALAAAVSSAAVSSVSVERLLGVGIGIAGPLDFRDGVVHDATGLPGWHDVPLRELVSARLGLPVLVDKDTNVAVVAEAWRRGPEFRDAAVVYVGTGVGAGLLLDGTVHRGARSGAGEFGHTTIQLDGPACACGRTGCVEAVHRVRVESGDLPAAADVLGVAVMDLVRLLDISHVVLSGRSVLDAPGAYLSGVRARVPSSEWLPVEVSVTALGADLVAVGAAQLVLGQLFA
ncbi:ROK family transcriptional regulator [Lentzea tibetensis]|uniref:ROK family transcriptional regulator n=1 Tax=Lentzea tibetensis TaxID=2591470 RepID=UPI002E2696B5